MCILYVNTDMIYIIGYISYLWYIYISYRYEFEQEIQSGSTMFKHTQSKRDTRLQRCQPILYLQLSRGRSRVSHLHGSSITTCCQKHVFSKARSLVLWSPESCPEGESPSWYSCTPARVLSGRCEDNSVVMIRECS